MGFSFPDIQTECPHCHQKNCAIWKGYYTRKFQDSETGLFGLIVIRVFKCRKKKRRIAYIPDFLLPRKKTSRAGIIFLFQEWCETFSVSKAIEAFNARMSDMDFDLPLSTAYSLLIFLLLQLRVNAEELEIPHLETNSLYELKNLSPEVLEKIKSGEVFQHSFLTQKLNTS